MPEIPERLSEVNGADPAPPRQQNRHRLKRLLTRAVQKDPDLDRPVGPLLGGDAAEEGEVAAARRVDGLEEIDRQTMVNGRYDYFFPVEGSQNTMFRFLGTAEKDKRHVVLDGGHMVFLVYEKLRGKPASEQVRIVATYVGLALIVSLMLVVIFLDVKHWL